MSNFWRSLDLCLFNCGTEFDLSRSRNLIMSEISRTAAVAGNLPNLAREATKTESVMFHEFSATLYVPVVTLSIKDNTYFLENINQRFKRTISWNNISLK